MALKSLFLSLFYYQGGPFQLGDIEDIDGRMVIACPWHHWRFDLVSGECLISDDISAECFPVRINGRQHLEIGFPALADATFTCDDF